jgi:type I restriction enzyme R subunit
MSSITESHVEEAALAWLTELGYGVKAGPDIAPDSSAPERPSYDNVVLAGRLARAVERLNPAIPDEARAEALRRIRQVEYPGLIAPPMTFGRRYRPRPVTHPHWG